MAVLKFGPKDKMGAMPMPDGYYSFEVAEISEPALSSSKKSYNMTYQFRVIDDETFEGKVLRGMFNTSTDRSSVMGTMYMMPAGLIPQLKAAIEGRAFDPKSNEEFDSAELKSGKFDAKVHRVISEGNVINTVSDFLPYGHGKAAEKEDIPF